MENKTSKLPSLIELRGYSYKLPYVFVGDDLKGNVRKSYPERGMSDDRTVFNYRMSRARRVLENTFRDEFCFQLYLSRFNS